MPRHLFARRAILAPLLVLSACGVAGDGTRHADSEVDPTGSGIPEPGIPEPGTLNPIILAVAASYPTDGTHAYHWPRSGSWPGTTRDLHYAGGLYAEGDPEGRCFCCGLTFEVFLRAWEQWADGDPRRERIPGIPDRVALKAFQDHWFGSNGDRTTCAGALVSRGLGTAIEDPDDARPGDFVQFWRYRGSGHQVVFAGWEHDDDGRRIGLRYWSTQGATNGIGTRTEPLGASVPAGRGIDASQVHIVRVGAMPPHAVPAGDPTSPAASGTRDADARGER